MIITYDWLEHVVNNGLIHSINDIVVEQDLNTNLWGEKNIQGGAPVRYLSWFITLITMAYGRYIISILPIVYKLTYDWGGGTTLYVADVVRNSV